ncbi:MAG: hypothetical protein R3B70_48355 [Polyangiaceae bacterium]
MPEAPLATDPESPRLAALERAHALAHRAAFAIEQARDPATDLAPALRGIERALTALYDAYDARADRPTSLGLANARLWDAAIQVAHAAQPAALEPLFAACRELIEAEAAPFPAAVPPRAPLLLASAAEPRLHTLARPSIPPLFRAPPFIAPPPAPVLPVVPAATTFAELARSAEALRQLAAARTDHLRRSIDTPPPPLPTAPLRNTPSPADTAPPGFATSPDPPESPRDFIHRWARVCFEEIGMLASQRAPLEGDDWRSSATLERRLTASLDALAALGPDALAHIEQLALDAPVPTPMIAHAAATIAGTFEGRDAFAIAERTLLRAGAADPLLAPAFAASLRLARNPVTNAALRSLAAAGASSTAREAPSAAGTDSAAGIAPAAGTASAAGTDSAAGTHSAAGTDSAAGTESADTPLRTLCTAILADRGALTREELPVLAEDPNPHIAAPALLAMGRTRHPDLDRLLPRVLAADSPAVIAAALDAMLLAAHPGTPRAAREAAKGPLGDNALLRLALSAREDDARWLLDRARPPESRTPMLLRSLGWTGHLEAVPLLLESLTSQDEALIAAAAESLDRLLGAGLRDTLEIDPERLDPPPLLDPDPDPPARRRPLTDLIDDPRDPAPRGSRETLEVPSRDPARWQSWLDQQPPYTARNQRLRRGRPYSAAVLLHELDLLSCSPDDRRLLHRELCFRTSHFLPFDPDDFVAAQERSLKAWETHLRANPDTPGAW